jgi:VWFA-related protein
MWRAHRVLLLSVLLLSISATATPNSQQQSSPPQDQQNQGIPDAPSSVQPSQPPPQVPPQAAPQTQPQAPNQQAPNQNVPPAAESAPANQNANPGPPPPFKVKTVPEGGQTKERPAGQDELMTIRRSVNQVVVPVMVKDESGHLVNGLTSRDFSLLENGKKQSLNFFTTDPFALSVAVVLDLGMKDVDLQRVNHTYSALQGAFSQFDEVSVYSYSNAVTQLSGWGAVGPKLTATLDDLQRVRGQNNGPPVTSGPIGPQGPIINGRPVDTAAPIVVTPVQQAHVLNDALLRAAVDLSQREHTRRKVIFIISDGREYRSSASYRDVLKVLLTNNILVYAVNVGGSALPVFNTLSRLHVPRLGYSNILPKYVNATGGGEVFNTLTRNDIEDAYSQAMGNARNQYTLGYITHAPLNGTYRTLEVLVDRPSCRSSIRPCVNVFAPDGYYPAPPRP